jgi:hypothetical protein
MTTRIVAWVGPAAALIRAGHDQLFAAIPGVDFPAGHLLL